MKKLMTAFAACLFAGIVSAQVQSENIVGYQTLTAPGQYYSSGATFITVGSATGEWRLGDVVATGMDPSMDSVQFLDPATANVSIQATYIDEATAISYGDAGLQGWWDAALENRLDDEVFAAGTGFLSSFASAGVTLTYSGEVLDGIVVLDLTGQQYPMIANFTPVDLTLGDLTATGMDPSMDSIQFLSVADANTEVQATYIDAATAIAYGDAGLQGWWDAALENRLDDQTFPAGASVLGSFANNVTITFPDPIL